MCNSPIILGNGQQIACRKCPLCLYRRTNDLVGRAIAESRDADTTLSVTLTYGRVDGDKDHLKANLLMYSDVQKFLKRLRKDEYQVRYMIVGEYGDLNRRAHWHSILYFKGRSPDLKLYERDWIKHWPHGHVYTEPMTPESVSYCCKYITKQDKQGGETVVRVSKKPPLGMGFFEKLAVQYVKEGLVPQKYIYSFDDVKTSKGKLRKFYMLKTARDRFMREYLLRYAEKHGTDRWPYSEIIEEFLDKEFARYYQFDDDLRRMGYGQKEKAAAFIDVARRRAEPHGGISHLFSGNTADIGAVVVCNDGTTLDLEKPQVNRFEEYLRIVSGRKTSWDVYRQIDRIDSAPTGTCRKIKATVSTNGKNRGKVTAYGTNKQGTEIAGQEHAC